MAEWEPDPDHWEDESVTRCGNGVEIGFGYRNHLNVGWMLWRLIFIKCSDETIPQRWYFVLQSHIRRLFSPRTGTKGHRDFGMFVPLELLKMLDQVNHWVKNCQNSQNSQNTTEWFKRRNMSESANKRSADPTDSPGGCDDLHMDMGLEVINGKCKKGNVEWKLNVRPNGWDIPFWNMPRN